MAAFTVYFMKCCAKDLMRMADLAFQQPLVCLRLGLETGNNSVVNIERADSCHDGPHAMKSLLGKPVPENCNNSLFVRMLLESSKKAG